MASLRRFWVLAPFILSLAFLSNAPSRAGELTDAVKSKDVARVQSLLAAGANVNEKVRRDYPLNVAAVYGPVETVTVLLEAGAGLEQPGRDGLRPLHNAVTSGRADIVALLIQRGAAVDARDSQGRSPLLSFAATAGSDIEIAKMLLAAGADPRIEDENLDTALNFASGDSGDVELVKLLIAAHADVNHAVDGWRPLLQAVFHSRYEIVGLLIAAGADVNVTRGPEGSKRTALSYAGNDAMRQLLIDAGAK